MAPRAACIVRRAGVKFVSAQAETFPARLEAFERIVAFVERVCAGAGIPRDAWLRVVLVVEELFVNTVLHGHGTDSDAPVRLSLDPQPRAIHVTYEDRAPGFDPSAGAADAGDPQERAPGGLGLVLVRRLSRDLVYSRAGDANRITFVIACS